MREEEVSNQKIASNISWKLAERFLAQGITLLITIILARVIAPEEYGIIAIVLVFINIANVFVTDGFSSALIQKKEIDEDDYSTAFITSLFLAILLYCVLVASAKGIANFYGYPIIAQIFPILGLRIPLSSFNSIQQAYVARNMLFKKFFFSTLGGITVSAIVGICMAYSGFGVWAVVGQYLTNTFIDTVVLFVTIDWKPRFYYSAKRAKLILNYGWKILVSGLLNAIYLELRSLLIGKIYTSSDLAFYNQGEKYPKFIATNVNQASSNVLFSAMAKTQDDRKKVKELTRLSVQCGMLLIAPIMIGIIATAPTLISVLLTDVWLPAVPYLRMACVIYLLYPLQIGNLQAIKAVGRSDMYLKMEIVKRIISIAIIIVAANISVYAIAISGIIIAIIAAIVNSYPSVKIIKYTYREQIYDFFKPVVISVIMGGGVMLLGIFDMADIIKLILQVIVGIVIYVSLSIWINKDVVMKLLKTVRRRKK